jgi:hypothetical protein
LQVRGGRGRPGDHQQLASCERHAAVALAGLVSLAGLLWQECVKP